MKTDSAYKAAFKFSLVMLSGALVGAVAGGFFALVVATFSPDLARGAFHSRGSVELHAYGVGMVWGCFVGLSVSGFACFLATCLAVVRTVTEGFGKAGKPVPPEKKATPQQQ